MYGVMEMMLHCVMVSYLGVTLNMMSANALETLLTHIIYSQLSSLRIKADYTV